MGRKAKFSYEIKIDVVTKCLQGKSSANYEANILGIKSARVFEWISLYKSLGKDGLITTSQNTKYSTTLKENAVFDYLNGLGSYSDICNKYGIRSSSQLRNWIMKYNSHNKFKTSGTGGLCIMTKGRATTYKERIEIIKYCIENENNYAETAEKYKVSYQQVYSWIKKYPDVNPIFHSDRGFQYASKNFKKKLDDAGMTQSMSRISRCIDNGPMEAFWGMLKSEMYYLKKFNSYSELETAIIEYIDYYNSYRYQKRLKCMTPLEYREYLKSAA